MKLCVLAPEFPPMTGGAARSAWRLVQALSNRGHEVRVIVPHPGENGWRSPRIETRSSGKIVLHHVLVPDKAAQVPSDWALAGLKRVPQVYACMRQILYTSGAPDVIWCFSAFPYGTAAGILAGELSRPYVIGLRGSDVTSNLFRPDAMNLVTTSCQQADFVVAVCSDLARMVERVTAPCIRHKVHVIANGYSACETEAERFHDSGSIVFGTVAEFRAKKHIDLLVQALGRLQQSVPQACAVFAGPFARDDESFVSSHMRAGSFVLTGRITEERAAAILAGLDVFVLPSVFEGCANTMMDALGAGIAVVASNVGGAKDLIVHGENGLLFEPMDSEGLLGCLESVCDRQRRAQLAQRGSSSIRTSEEEADDWEELLLTAMKHRC